jgi:hypothetical protein
VVFLQWLKNALQKHTNAVPESQEGEIVLKDKFLTQSVPYITTKLQKLVTKRSKNFDQLVQATTSVYYNGSGKGKNKDKWQEALSKPINYQLYSG